MKIRVGLPFLIMAAAVLAVYGWAISFGFLYYDDHINVFENQPLLGGQILYFWKSAHEGLYVPLVYTAWSVLYKLFGLNPAAFHAFNITLHIANTWLVFLILQNLKISKKSALLAALLFAVHPIQVESVVWVSSLKDTSFGFFSLLAIWIYLFSSGGFVFRWTAGAISVSAAILCKPTAAVLPVLISAYLILMSDGDFKNRVRKMMKVVGPLPLTLLLASFSIQMARAGQSWSNHPNAAVTLLERPLVMLDSLGFYLTKLALPIDYYVDYARYPRNVLDNGLFYFNLIIGTLFIGWLFYRFFAVSKARTPVFVLAALLGLLFFLPTSGIVTFGHQKISTTADRYMYVVMAGVAMAAARLLDKLEGSSATKLAGKAAVMVLFGLGMLSFMQAINWKDITLFTDHLYEGNPKNYYANRNLGLLYQLKGEEEKALEYFMRAQNIDPSHLSAQAAIVSLYFNRREYDKMDKFIAQNLNDEKLAQLQQTSYETHAFFMAVAESFIERQDYSKAMTYLCKAKRLGIAQFAGEILGKIESIKKLDAESAAACVN